MTWDDEGAAPPVCVSPVGNGLNATSQALLSAFDNFGDGSGDWELTIADDTNGDGGTLNERVNFAVNELNDITKPGIQDIVSRMTEYGTLSPDEFVDRTLDLIGPMVVGDDTKNGLLRYANTVGELRFGTQEDKDQSAERIGRMLQLIVASREYQFA